MLERKCKKENDEKSLEGIINTERLITEVLEEVMPTLWKTEFDGKNLTIQLLKTEYRTVAVYSSGKKYVDGDIKLKKGDDIFIVTKKYRLITFLHYRIIALRNKNNCELIYYTKIDNMKDISKLPNRFYKSFIKDFISANNL